MRACIHRGTCQIGGTCVELEARGQRLVLDVGLPLDAPGVAECPLPPVTGFERRDRSLLGVVISHPHQDHYGLASRLPSGTPFLIGADARRILSAAALFSPAGIRLEPTVHLCDRTPIRLGPFTITPYLADHSAYDSYAVLVEADGSRLFYSGDFRAHGRKAVLFDRLVRQPPRGVDVLLMEGTTIGRMAAEVGCTTEAAVERELVALFDRTQGLPLVWCSGQNIDRIVSVYRACRRTGRDLIVDGYVAQVLRATGNPKIPKGGWPGVRVFLPFAQRRLLLRTRRFDVAHAARRCRIFPEALRAAAPRSVLLFRPSLIRDLERADCLDGSRLICSLWPGYLKVERHQGLLDWVRQRGFPLDLCHTSGHASMTDLRRLRAAFVDAVVVPIHTTRAHAYEASFGNAYCAEDGAWWQVTQDVRGRMGR